MTVILSALIASTLAIPSLEVISHFICPSLFMCGLFLSGLARIISLSHRDHRLSLSLLAFCCLGCQLNSSYSPTLLLALRSHLWSLTVYSLSLSVFVISLSLALSPRAPSRCLGYLCMLFLNSIIHSGCTVVLFSL